MRKIKAFIINREFLRYFLMLFSGTLLAQVITIMISPILTRLYTPSDFGVYGVYLSIVTLLLVFVTGRYEFAINSTEKDDDAKSLFKLINYLTVFSTFFILILIIFVGDSLLQFLGLHIRSKYLFFIPITLLLLGFLQSTTYYLNRQKNFKVLTKSKLYQSLANATTSISAGILNLGAFGLIIANIVGVFIAQFIQRINGINKSHTVKDYKLMKSNMKKYKQYPLYNAPSAFFDTIAMQAPVFVLLRYFSESIVGFYNLTIRVIGMPLTLISTSISQVFLSQISELHRENKKYKHVVINTTKYLSIIGLIPLILLMLFGPNLFTIVFGNDWEKSGQYARILSVSYYFKFIVSPLSMVFFINNKVKLLSILQSIRALTTVVILISFALYFNITVVLYAYAIHEIFFYVVYFRFILKTSK